MRRWTLLLALLALLVPLAAGCGGGDDEGGGDTGGDAATAPEGTTSDVSGSLSIMGIWTGDEQASFQAVIDGFNEQYPDVEVKYNPVGDNLPTVLSTAVEGGNPPDLAAPAQPGLIQGFVDRDAVVDIEFARDAITENMGESGVAVGTFNEKLYGLLFKADNKSLVWYNVQAFSDAGVEPPTDWPSFLEAADTLNAFGLPAHSVAASQGWVLTDLFENIYIRTAGPEKYDQLSRHEIPWTDESVKEALTEMAKVIGDSNNVAGGTEGALQMDFETSVSNVLSDDPKAAMIAEGDFVPGVIKTDLEPGTGYDVFDFPAINDSPPSVVTSGNVFIRFTDNPASEAFINYLATPEAAQIWAELGGFGSPNKNLDPAVYPNELQRKTAGAIGQAEVLRFDLSDLQPGEFGATEGQGLWKLFQDFFQNPDDVDGIARQMEQAASAAYGE
jgi:ABC-type glycerol-3-phosphate transport system substrate-binding protein